MEGIQELVDNLCNKDHNRAYECMKDLVQQSDLSARVYPFFDRFAQMMDDPNSYIRTRGLILIAHNARWDEDNRIDEIIDSYLTHIEDDKPITSRQCIQVLPMLAGFKPDLKADIVSALKNANTLRYPGSMQPLVRKDIQKALVEMGE